MSVLNPAEALLQVVMFDGAIIKSSVIDSVKDYIDHNETGLAYDELIFQIENNFYRPSSKALKLIKHAAQELKIIYPNWSC
jgi:hypothetical protein